MMVVAAVEAVEELRSQGVLDWEQGKNASEVEEAEVVMVVVMAIWWSWWFKNVEISVMVSSRWT